MCQRLEPHTFILLDDVATWMTVVRRDLGFGNRERASRTVEVSASRCSSLCLSVFAWDPRPFSVHKSSSLSERAEYSAPLSALFLETWLFGPMTPISCTQEEGGFELVPLGTCVSAFPSLKSTAYFKLETSCSSSKSLCIDLLGGKTLLLNYAGPQ